MFLWTSVGFGSVIKCSVCMCKLNISYIYIRFHGKYKYYLCWLIWFLCMIFVVNNQIYFELNITTISTEMWHPLHSWHSLIHNSLVQCFSVKLVWFIVVYYTVWHITWSSGIHPVTAMVIRNMGFCTAIFYCRFWLPLIYHRETSYIGSQLNFTKICCMCHQV